MGIKTPLVSTYFKHTITLATPRESSPQSLLPTEKPTEPQIQYTISEEDFSDISPPLYQNTWLMHFCVGTYQNSGSTKTVDCEVYINDVLWKDISQGNVNNDYLCMSFRKNGVNVGDTVHAYVWESTGATQLESYGISITPSRLCPQNNKTLINLKMNNTTSVPIFNFNGLAATGVNRYNLKHIREETVGTTQSVDSPSWESEADDFILRQQYGDNYGGDWYHANNGSTTLYMYGNRIPQNIEYEVLHD